MLIPSYESLVSSGSLLLIFVVMVSNGFFSFPSSQILYITLGFFIASGKLPLLPVILVGALGNTLGNQALFLVTKKYGQKAARKFLPLSEKTFEAVTVTFKERSLLWLGIGKLTPSLKVVVPILAGISKTNTLLTFFTFLFTSLIWATAFIFLGMFFGKSFSFGTYGIIISLFGIAVALYFSRLVSKKQEELLP